MGIHANYEWRKISPDGVSCFFGYYDRNPWNNEWRKNTPDGVSCIFGN